MKKFIKNVVRVIIVLTVIFGILASTALIVKELDVDASPKAFIAIFSILMVSAAFLLVYIRVKLLEWVHRQCEKFMKEWQGLDREDQLLQKQFKELRAELGLLSFRRGFDFLSTKSRLESDINLLKERAKVNKKKHTELRKKVSSVSFLVWILA